MSNLIKIGYFQTRSSRGQEASQLNPLTVTLSNVFKLYRVLYIYVCPSVALLTATDTENLQVILSCPYFKKVFICNRLRVLICFLER